MGQRKEAEPMGLAIMRERFRYAATSQCVNWEPSDVADMALTLEALAEVYRETLDMNSFQALKAAEKVRR